MLNWHLYTYDILYLVTWMNTSHFLPFIIAPKSPWKKWLRLNQCSAVILTTEKHITLRSLKLCYPGVSNTHSCQWKQYELWNKCIRSFQLIISDRIWQISETMAWSYFITPCYVIICFWVTSILVNKGPEVLWTNHAVYQIKCNFQAFAV